MKFIFLVLAILAVFTYVHSQQDSVFVVLSGDSTTIWNVNVIENCASRFKCSVFISDSNGVMLTETDTIGPIANCICTYDLSTVLLGLGAGYYTVDVYRRYLSKYGYPKDTTIRIGSTSFDIISSQGSVSSQQFYQSACRHDMAVQDVAPTPLEFLLSQNFPNPANPGTTISFSLQRSSFVTLKIYNVLGQVVSTLIRERRAPGSYSVQFDASELPSGVYYYRLSADEFVQTKSMLVIR